MKKFLVAVIILGLNVTAFAAEKEVKEAKSKIKVTYDLSAKKANLLFVPSGEEKIVVKILNANGQVIFVEHLNESSSFNRPYNFSELASANYTILVKEGTATYKEEISFETKPSAEFGAFQISASELAPGKVSLKVLQEDVNTVFVSVKNRSGKVLYSTAVADQASFVQNFDISKVKENIYFEVRSSNGVKTVEL